VALSKKRRIVDAVVARLQTITVANGYNTGAGARVYRGRVEFTASDPLPVLTVLQDNVFVESDRGERMLLALPLGVQGIVTVDRDNPSDAVDDLEADILTALFAVGDDTLSDLVSEIKQAGRIYSDIEAGTTVAGLSVNTDIKFIERVGDPYT